MNDVEEHEETRPAPEKAAGPGRPQILVGVSGERSRHVIATAAWYAERFDAELTFAAVDADPFTMGETPTGYLVTIADLSGADRPEREFPATLARMIDETLAPHEIPWHPRVAAGSPSRELSVLAEEIDALMIVVGTREGLRGAVREAVNGSVAAALSHRQHRPVVVVPLDPVTEGGARLIDRLAAIGERGPRTPAAG